MPRDEHLGDLPLYSAPGRDAEGSYADADHFYFRSSMPVVDTFVRHSATDPVGWISRFGYQEALYDASGRGFRGFRKIIDEDVTRGLRTTRLFEQKFPLSGAVRCEAVSELLEAEDCKFAPGAAMPTRSPIRLSLADWNPVLCGDGSCPQPEQRYWTVLPAVQESYAYEPGSVRRLTSSTEIEQTFSDDGYALPLAQTSAAVDYASDGVTPKVERTEVIARTFDAVDTNAWWIERPTSERRSASIRYGSSHAPAPGVGIGIGSSTSGSTTLIGWNTTHRQPDCKAIIAALPAGTPLGCRDAVPGTTASFESRQLTSTFDAWGNPQAVSVWGRDAGPSSTTTTSFGTGVNDGYFPLSVTNALQQVASSGYNLALGLPQSATDVRGLTTSYTLDPLGRVQATIPPNIANGSRRAEPPTWVAYQWCTSAARCPPNSNALTRIVTRRPGSPTVIAYQDAESRAVRTETTAFDGTGVIVTTREYDTRGRLLRETGPASGGAVAGIPETQYRYDSLDRVVRKWQGRPDLSGQTRAAPATGIVTRYTHEGLRTDIAVQPCAVANANTLDCATPPTASTIDQPLAMSRTYGSDGRILSTTDANLPVAGVTRYWYDALGNARAIQDPKGTAITASYDALGRRVASNDPSRGLWTFGYDGLGRLAWQRDARWQGTSGGHYELRFGYDALGRPRERRWREPDLTPHNADVRCMIDHWTYDVVAGLPASESRERVASLDDGGTCSLPPERSESITRTFQYDSSTSTPHGDPFYRPTSVETRITLGTGTDATQTFQTQHRYDRWYGRVKQRVHPGGVGVYFAYSDRGDLVEEGLSADFVAYGSPDNAYLRKLHAVDAFGQPTEVRQGRDAQRWLARRDGQTGWMLEVCAQTGSATCNQLATNPQVRSAKWMDLGYRYDAYGNVIEQRALAVGPHGTALGSPHTAPIVDTYAYDTLHRVTANTVTNVQVVGNAPTTRTTNLRYDSVGNLTRKSDLSVDADTGYTYTGSYRLNRINAPGNATLDFGYDANGNVTARTPAGTLNGAPRRLAIDYDVDNLPLRISTEASGVGTQGHHFRYGPDGERYVEETRTNSQTAFVRLTVDGVYERDRVQPTGALVERWHLAEGVMLVRNSGTGEPQSGVHFIGRDRLGSSTVVTRLTEAGTVVPVNDANGRADHRSYDLYGRPRDAWADPRAGRPIGDDAGLHRARAPRPFGADPHERAGLRSAGGTVLWGGPRRPIP